MSKITFDEPKKVPTLDGFKEVTEISLPKGHRKSKEPYNFKEKVKKVEALGKLQMEDFNSAEEAGMFIDWMNEMNRMEKQKRADNEIHEISKFLARTLGSKTFII